MEKNETAVFDKVEAPSHYYKDGVWCEDAIKTITSYRL